MTIARAAHTQYERLRRSRLVAGLDQEQLAAALGYNRNTISAWERGVNEPPFSAVARWARLTGTSLDWLAYGDEEGPDSGESGPSMQSRLSESNRRPFHYE